VAATLFGVGKGYMLNLDHGWRGTYHSNSAEGEKECNDQNQYRQTNGNESNGVGQGGQDQQNGQYGRIRGPNSGLRQRET